MVARIETHSEGAGSESKADGRPLIKIPAEKSPASVVFLGDSLTRGYGLDMEQAFPALIAGEIEKQELPFKVVNAGVSGMTSAGGLERLDWVLSDKARVLVVALGGNDGLRGLSPSATESNLDQIVSRSLQMKIVTLLAEMQMPPNYGPEYAQAFRDVFKRVAQRHDVHLIPFLLSGVAGLPEMNQSDGIHPNADGQKVLAANVWRHLGPVLEAMPNPST